MNELVILGAALGAGAIGSLIGYLIGKIQDKLNLRLPKAFEFSDDIVNAIQPGAVIFPDDDITLARNKIIRENSEKGLSTPLSDLE